MPSYRIVMEDATRYLPHDPTGIEYQCWVYDDDLTGPFGGPAIRFSGTRSECKAWVAKVSAAIPTG